MKSHIASLAAVFLLGTTGSVFSDMQFGYDYDEGVAGGTPTQDVSANNRDGALSGAAAIVTDHPQAVSRRSPVAPAGLWSQVTRASPHRTSPS